eukprot:g72967.t1
MLGSLLLGALSQKWLFLPMNTIVDESGPIKGSVTLSKQSGTPTFHSGLVDGDEVVAVGVLAWNEGWHELTLNATNCPHCSDQDTMYAAGYLEGALTSHLIWPHYLNTFDQFFGHDSDRNEGQNASSPRMLARNWTSEHLYWLEAEAKAKHSSFKYWNEVSLVLAQIHGLTEGYNAKADNSQRIDFLDMFMLNMDGDMITLLPYLASNWPKLEEGAEAIEISEKFNEQLMRYWSRDHLYPIDYPRPYGGSMNHFKCSALVRLLPDGSDLFVGHSTWDGYGSMLRVYKHYHWGLREQGQRALSFSSSPGYLSSVDDFYITGHGLVVTETTNGVYDTRLFKQIRQRGVLSWMRALVASYSATDGFKWSRQFRRKHSGTYNNQWLVVDMPKFQRWQEARHQANPTDVTPPPNGLLATDVTPLPLPHGLLVVSEEVPGYVHSQDCTSMLARQGYFASYNIPFFTEIFKMSGFEALAETKGDTWVHGKSPRARIFARDAPNVLDMDGFKKLMTLNDYLHDPLSDHNPVHAIMSRMDLLPSSSPQPTPSVFFSPSPLPPFHHRLRRRTEKDYIRDKKDPSIGPPEAYGGIDCKVTSSALALSMKADAMMGPTHADLPPFSWSGCQLASCRDTRHEGHVDLFNFSFTRVAPAADLAFLQPTPTFAFTPQFASSIGTGLPLRDASSVRPSDAPDLSTHRLPRLVAMFFYLLLTAFLFAIVYLWLVHIRSFSYTQENEKDSMHNNSNSLHGADHHLQRNAED